jgi:excisionase family DNA binding protein
MTSFYSLEQVAEVLGVHIRTVRNFVHDGRLPATRIGKQYRVAAEDLGKLTGQPASALLAADRLRHIETSSIVEIEAVDPDTAERITAMLMAASNSRREGPPLKVQTSYDESRARLKVMVIGGIDDTIALLKTLKALSEP